MVEAINRLRRDPAGFVQILEAQRRLYRGFLFMRPYGPPIQTDEGARAVDEAIAALRPPRYSLSLLELSEGLSASALQHVKDTGKRGLVGHGSFADRVSKFGRWTGGVGECISYGDADPVGVVAQLLIDDGVHDRGHRHALLDPSWRYVGVSCGAHSVYRGMCVMDFAVAFEEK